MENSQSVTITIRYRPTDLYSPFMWSWNSLVRWTIAAVLAYAVYDLFLQPSSSVREFRDWQSIVAIIVVLAVFIVLGLVVFPFLRVYAMFRKSPAFQKPVHKTFSPEGIHSKSEDTESTLKWSALIRVQETRTHFYFYQTTYYANFVPKRFFENKDQIAQLRKLILENFKGKWRLRRD